MGRRSALELIRRVAGREVAKNLISTLVDWPPLRDPEPGYSILVGVPWDLRHLLEVNLRFIAGTRRSELLAIHVVFDRTPRSEGESLIGNLERAYSELPLHFHFYARAPGFLVELLNVSTFYNSMNCVTGVSRCRTRWLILHDFDLYPLVPDYFERIHRKLQDESLRFVGVEQTYFDGLLDSDRVFGTWGLGMDAEWIRNDRRAIEIFHRMVRLRREWTSLDPFSWLQLQTDRRALAPGLGSESFCHARNLCSTYLRMRSGRAVHVAWRLHYLWYLENLAGRSEGMLRATEAMQRAAGSTVLRIEGYQADFGDTDRTCADVLRGEIERMEKFLFGEVRPEVMRFLAAFESFLHSKSGKPGRVPVVVPK